MTSNRNHNPAAAFLAIFFAILVAFLIGAVLRLSRDGDDSTPTPRTTVAVTVPAPMFSDCLDTLSAEDFYQPGFQYVNGVWFGWQADAVGSVYVMGYANEEDAAVCVIEPALVPDLTLPGDNGEEDTVGS